jgi:uncharacterized protein (TIGR02611 family)
MKLIQDLRNRMDAMGLRQARRVVVFVVGMTVLLLGVVMILLPGPAILVIPAGLAILGLEFRWARRLLRRAKAILTPPPKPPPKLPPEA